MVVERRAHFYIQITVTRPLMAGNQDKRNRWNLAENCKIGVRSCIATFPSIPSATAQDDMELVVHQALDMAHPVEALADLSKEIELFLTVRIVSVNGLATVTP